MSVSRHAAAGKEHPSLRDRVYHHLARKLQSSSRHASACLDLEAICRELRISRTPLRDALLRLEQEGMIVIRPRRGVFIRPVGQEELAEICRILGLLEADALESSLPRQRQSLLPGLESALAAQRHAVSAHDPAAFRQAENAFHQQLLGGAAPSVRASLAGPLYRRLAMLPRSRESERQRAPRILAVHERLLDSLQRGNVTAAASILRYEYWVPGLFTLLPAGRANKAVAQLDAPQGIPGGGRRRPHGTVTERADRSSPDRPRFPMACDI
ncbi:GntR family transcriptional regulator [uncultured Desulfovibrio sp.]|uniref:GntR family transcriptional regulator n=2 Tax=uncultured Desulfovibrio sp. TaxID=167968 RepID=UPI0025CC8F86|nr:GntR family transcriptional regulator [uncultured Desulfovibrio sp.]